MYSSPFRSDPFFPPKAQVLMHHSKHLQRRPFLQGLAAVVGGTAVASSSLKAKSPNDRLNLAFVGVGGRGGANLEELTKDGGVNV
ncbi:MAG: hypothetical protein ACOVQM_12545, partial [Pirellula sp.]